jgi:hypothetical protein
MDLVLLRRDRSTSGPVEALTAAVLASGDPIKRPVEP